MAKAIFTLELGESEIDLAMEVFMTLSQKLKMKKAGKVTKEETETVKDTKAETSSAASSQPAAPQEAEKPAPEPAQDPAVTYTLEQVRDRLAKLSQAGKSAEMKKIIASFGVSKLTEIPADKYPEVMKAVEEVK